jgi:hypothetical protein
MDRPSRKAAEESSALKALQEHKMVIGEQVMSAARPQCGRLNNCQGAEQLRHGAVIAA